MPQRPPRRRLSSNAAGSRNEDGYNSDAWLRVHLFCPQRVLCPCMTASALSILFFARFSGKERKESLWCGERSQGRRSLAFISTLDTGLRTFTIDPGTKVRVLF